MTLLSSFRDFFAPEIETYRTLKHGTKYTITQKGSMRYFKVDGIVYSQLDENSIYVGSYHDKFLLLPLVYEKSKVLVIGLGAGTVPFQLSKLYKKNVSTEVVEINSDYLELTKRFLPKGGMDFKTVFGKGEVFVDGVRGKYDIIIQDAYDGMNVPEPFLTDKFISDAYTALKSEGILAINYAPEVLYLPIYIHNLKKRFRYVYRIKHISLGNYILVCSKNLNKSQIIERIESRIDINRANRRILRAYKSMS